MSKQQNVLVGKTITAVSVAKDGQALKFDTTDGEILVGVDADCCSHTWVEHVELPALGFPCLVHDARDVDMPNDSATWDESHSECTAYYGFKITTDKGEILIDYRNLSNGYYGGNLVFPPNNLYGGVFGQNVSTYEWVPAETYVHQVDEEDDSDD